jgi:sortase A
VSQETRARETPAHRAAPGGSGDSLGERRRGRGVGFWLGVLLVVGGLGMLGYVAWQFYGTTYVAKQVQDRVVEELTEEWSVAPSTQVGGVKEPEAPVGEPIGLVRIPAFGDDYVVPILQGTTDDVLSSGFGHFDKTAGPGEKGNFALAGHRVTHGEPLRDMPELRPGDEVIVETRSAVYTYELDTDPNDLIVTFEDIWVIDRVPSNPDGGVEPAQTNGQRLITLTTCAELFHTDNRMIAFGHLVDTEPKQASAAG